MKKFFFLITVLTASALNCTAQVDTMVTVGQRADGTSLTILGTQFKNEIVGFSAEPQLNYVCLYQQEPENSSEQLYGIGRISVYNPQERSVLWVKAIPLNCLPTISTKSGILVFGNGTNRMLKVSDGTLLWMNSYSLTSVMDTLGIAIGHHSSTSDIFCAVNLADGKELYNVEMPHKFGCSGMTALHGSRQLAVTDNLYDVDIMNGDMRMLKLKTGIGGLKALITKPYEKSDSEDRHDKNGLNIVYDNLMPCDFSTITSLVSNVCRHDNAYFIADREHVTCTDSLLHPLWTAQLPSKLASHSQLAVHGERLDMLNMGYGLINGETLTPQGTPFMASFDRRTGTMRYLKKLSSVGPLIEESYGTKDGGIFLHSDTILAYCNFSDTSFTRRMKWNTERHGHIIKMVTDTMFVSKSLNNFVPFVSDDTTCSVISDNGNIYTLDKNLNIIAVHHRDEMYYVEATGKKFRVIGNNLYEWVVTPDGKMVAQLNNIKKVFATGNRLFVVTQDNAAALLLIQ